MNIFIPIFTIPVIKSIDLDNEENPGIGGTQHVSLTLASRLAKAMPKWDVKLVNTFEIELINSPPNLNLEIFKDLDDFIKTLSCSSSKENRAIFITKLLKELSEKNLKAIADKTYCWIHHPFYYDFNLLRANFLAYICVGEYQQLTNKYFYPRCIFIQNIFPNNSYNLEDKFLRKKINQPLRLVYIGSLIPVKGFHEIAKQWNNIKEHFKDVRLDVIGKSYSVNQSMHDLIPATNDYANLILKYISVKDIFEKKVNFHGNLGLEKKEMLKSAHLALQNPRGLSEAFPASPLECMSLGVPVIASDDYGMYDSMKYFPELAITNPKQIKEKIILAISNPSFYKELSMRSFSIANMFALNSYSHIWRWVNLIQNNSFSEQNKNFFNSNFNKKKSLILKVRVFKNLTKVYLKKLLFTKY